MEARQAQRESEGLRCPAITKHGDRCKRHMLPGDDFCSQHDPRHAERRKRAAAKAGAMSSPPMTESREIRQNILRIVEDVRRRDVDHTIAYAVSSLCNVAINSLRLEVKIRELEEIERRLDSLETKLQEGVCDEFLSWATQGLRGENPGRGARRGRGRASDHPDAPGEVRNSHRRNGGF
jgi:hypothetical protein